MYVVRFQHKVKSRFLFFISGYAFVSDLSTVAASNKPDKETFESDRVPLVKSFGFPFKAGSLQPGTYKFRVAANTTSCNSYSETTFVINAPPFAGNVSGLLRLYFFPNLRSGLRKKKNA